MLIRKLMRLNGFAKKVKISTFYQQMIEALNYGKCQIKWLKNQKDLRIDQM